MTGPTLRVLDGGQSLDIRRSNRHFISAYVTDTRLMGVLAVYAHWHIDNYPEDDVCKDNGCKGNASESNIIWGDLHQFFYIDCEESGIETYHEVRESDTEKIETIEQMLIGGLGAGKVDLNEAQFRGLMCHWRRFNIAHGLPLPEKESHYDFIFEPERPDSLMELICPAVRTDLQLVNYFLMRCFGRDHEGAAFLSAEGAGVAIDTYDRYERATFCRNVIDDKAQLADGSKEYLCESIIEMDGEYDRIVSLITVKDLKVTGLICRSITPISQSEATLVMKKSEFVTVYEILLSEDELENNIDEFTMSFHTTMTEYENGRLFLSYRPNNDHVNRRVFQLNEDVRGMLFLSDCGQLIVAAYNEGDVITLENMIRGNVLAPYLIMSGRYEFKTPVIYEFMQSDLDTFESFLRALRGDDN